MGLKLRCVEAASVVLQAEHRYTAKLTLAEAPEGEQASGAQQQPQQQQPSNPEQKALEAGPAGQEGGAADVAGQSQHQEADQLHPRPNRRPRARHRDPGHWRWRLISFELLPGAVMDCSSCISRGSVLAINRLSWLRTGNQNCSGSKGQGRSAGFAEACWQPADCNAPSLHPRLAECWSACTAANVELVHSDCSRLSGSSTTVCMMALSTCQGLHPVACA